MRLISWLLLHKSNGNSLQSCDVGLLKLIPNTALKHMFHKT